MSDQNSFDVLGIGNALVDVLSHESDEFVTRMDLNRGAMTLIDEARAHELYASMGPGVEISGGSAANTMVGLASFGARAAYLGKVRDDAPVILLAHEPDILVRVPERVSLVLSGHTHGGQVRLFGWSPIVPSRYGNRFAYGHIREQCDLIVSGGLGCSGIPVRLGMPPEIVLVNVSAEQASTSQASI